MRILKIILISDLIRPLENAFDDNTSQNNRKGDLQM